jgi:hypothetical protein
MLAEIKLDKIRYSGRIATVQKIGIITKRIINTFVYQGEPSDAPNSCFLVDTCHAIDIKLMIAIKGVISGMININNTTSDINP